MTSPGASSVPANSEPIMTVCAPAASALATSPEYLIPPSEMIGFPCFSAHSAQSATAVTCGTPTPATTRVVQIDPGPMPIFTASAPARTSDCVASAVATLPAITCTSHSDFTRSTICGTEAECPCAVSTTSTS